MHGLKIMDNLKKASFGRDTFKQIELRHFKEKTVHGKNWVSLKRVTLKKLKKAKTKHFPISRFNKDNYMKVQNKLHRRWKILCLATVNWQVSINGLTGAVHIDQGGRRQNYSIGVYRVGFKENPRKVSMASLQPKQCCNI